jgi:phospholipid/cholesterol/gamma-HCH transport system substrate-binding protein
MGRLLSADDKMYRDLEDTVTSIKNVAASLEKGEGTLGKLIKDDNKIYNDLDATVANLKLVTDRLAKGEGTLGKLSADDQLYSDVHALIKDVRQTVDNYRDTTPISAFASLLMGAL